MYLSHFQQVRVLKLTIVSFKQIMASFILNFNNSVWFLGIESLEMKIEFSLHEC